MLRLESKDQIHKVKRGWKLIVAREEGGDVNGGNPEQPRMIARDRTCKVFYVKIYMRYDWNLQPAKLLGSLYVGAP